MDFIENRIKSVVISVAFIENNNVALTENNVASTDSYMWTLAFQYVALTENNVASTIK